LLAFICAAVAGVERASLPQAQEALAPVYSIDTSTDSFILEKNQ